MRGFRDIAADADDLGRAAAQANRAARKTYANVPSPSPEFDRLEPSLENRGADPDAPYSYDEFVEEAERYAPPPQAPRPRVARRPRAEEARAGPATVFPFKSAIAVGIVLILVGAAILWGKSVVTTVSGLFKPSQTAVEAPKDTSRRWRSRRFPIASASRRRRNRSRRWRSASCCMTRIPSDPKGKQYVGSVIWRTEQIKAAAGQKADLAVRADIEIPDRKFKMTMSFRRNTDTSLPASHTAELTFILPPDFAGGGVGNVPGILMKSNEQARGTPLAGPRGQGHRRLLPGRPVQCRRRPRAQPAAPEGALVVRRAAGLCQPAPRHHRHREGRARRARVQRRVRGVGGVGDLRHRGLDRRSARSLRNL